MTHTDVIPTSASTASVGKGIRYVGKWAYAFSGIGQAGTSGDFDALSFTSGSGVIKARIYCSIDNDDLNAGTQVGWKIVLNNIQILVARVEATANDILDARLTPYVDLIIPPLTKVDVVAFSNATNVDTSFLLSGRVYGAE